MHVVVVGCGRVGSELAGSLQASGHTVAVIDKTADAFRRLGPASAARRSSATASTGARSPKPASRGASALAAVTSGDNSNILTARVARENFGIERVVARIYDPRRAAIFQKLGIPTVATVSWTTDQVLRRLLPAEHHSEWLDPTGAVALIELNVSPRPGRREAGRAQQPRQVVADQRHPPGHRPRHDRLADPAGRRRGPLRGRGGRHPRAAGAGRGGAGRSH